MPIEPFFKPFSDPSCINGNYGTQDTSESSIVTCALCFEEGSIINTPNVATQGVRTHQSNAVSDLMDYPILMRTMSTSNE